jgi:predicted nucleotidyltransferase
MKSLPDTAVLAEFCKTHHIRRLAVFGSVIRGEARPHSDIDFLVEYDPQARPGLVELQRIEDELSQLCGGRRVDLVNPKYLSPRLKDRILAEAQLQYADKG